MYNPSIKLQNYVFSSLKIDKIIFILLKLLELSHLPNKIVRYINYFQKNIELASSNVLKYKFKL
jgi:hypothetical protein